MGGTCMTGDQNTKNGVAEALAYFMQESDTAATLKNIDHFCTQVTDREVWSLISSRLNKFIAGVAFILLGMVWQMSMHATNYEKVVMSEDLDEEQERAAIQAYYAHHGHHYGAT